MVASVPSFAGNTYEPVLDGQRLAGQLERVKALMLDGSWRSLAEIRELLGNRDSEAGISARLRDLRKAHFGRHAVDRRRRYESKGLWEYRLVGDSQRSLFR